MAHDQIERDRFVMDGTYRFVFKVLGRYEARLAGNEPHVTLNVSAGRDDHVVFCGTLTMSEHEWATFKDHLYRAKDDRVEIAVEGPVDA